MALWMCRQFQVSRKSISCTHANAICAASRVARGGIRPVLRLWCYAGTRQVLPGSRSRRRPETHGRGQPLQFGARNAKNVPESAICSVRRKRPTTTGSVVWLVPISTPRSALHRVRRANLPSDALPFRIPHSALRISPDGAARLIDRHRLEVRIGGVGEGHGNWVASSS